MAWKTALTVVLLISTTALVTVNGDETTINDSQSECPKNCKCKDQEVRCSFLSPNSDFFLPERTTLLYVGRPYFPYIESISAFFRDDIVD